MNEFSKENLLRSWKEIAAYLGCDVRTCHRWEVQRGMPVHRAEGSETKSPVFAYRDELDRWFQETFTASNNRKEKARGLPAWAKWAAGAVLILGLAGGSWLLLGRRTRRQPADFSIEGSVFIALDKQKRELWRQDLKVPDLQSEDYYRQNFQTVHKDGNILPVLCIGDIDKDGDSEVLFALRRKRDQTGEGILYCWDRRGRELWKFAAGSELKCGPTVFSPDYRIVGIFPHDVDGDGRLEIAVESFQAPEWPCQLALLDSSGRKTGEFWNAGYLREVAFKDIDGDGREELIVVGVNNEFQGGCLIVFDTRRIGGGSPQTGRFACDGVSPGTMLYYVTTPYPDVAKVLNFRVEGFGLVEITNNNWIRASTASGLIWEFDFDLRCVQVTWGHTFEIHHDEGVKAGTLTSVLGDGYARMLREGVRWWNGAEWTAEPSMVRR
ncbi:MAG: VCBS repeat-containing protein [Acidobacteriota bacterium]